MSTEAVKVPKFRKVSRVVPWMLLNEYEERIPQVEALFLTTKEKPGILLKALTDYENMVSNNGFPQELKDLIYEKAKEYIPTASENDDIVQDFLHTVHNTDDKELAQKYLDLFAGKSSILVQYSKWNRTRLPTHLEDSINDPGELLTYATEIVKGRLPSHLEDVFHKDVDYAIQYAFEVIRGFAPVKLPDNLHNFIVMESFANPDNHYIKNYMNASENDPNKTGNYKDNYF
jgi:hypothetical protein